MYYVEIQVRDFEYSSEAQESRKEELEKLMQDQEAMRASLLQWCYASYSEVHVFLGLFNNPVNNDISLEKNFLFLWMSFLFHVSSIKITTN